MPSFPGLDGRHPSSFSAPNPFFDALQEGRQAILRAEEERNQHDEDAEYARLLEQDSRKGDEAHRRAMDAEYARPVEEDLRKAEAARRRAEDEVFARLLEEDRRKAEEAHRQAMEQEERQRQAERESTERARRKRERLEEECEAAHSNLAARLCLYEDKWAFLQSNAVKIENISFFAIPWPSFEDIRCVGDITKERVIAFMCHPLREHIQCAGERQARCLRSEIMRWHPDKFEGKVLGKVAEGDREAAKEAAGEVARILTVLNANMPKR